MKVEHVGSTRGGMVKYRLNGVLCYTRPGALMEDVFDKLHDMEVFTAKDLTVRMEGAILKDVSRILGLLYKKGALGRTRSMVYIEGTQSEYIYYPPGGDLLVQEYLLDKIKDPPVKEAVIDFLTRDVCASSIRLQRERGISGFGWIINFVKIGAIKARKEVIFDGRKRVSIWIYYSPLIKKKRLENLIEKELRYCRMAIKDRGDEGRRFEDLVAAFFEKAIENGDLYFRPVGLPKRRVYFKLPTQRRCEIDLLMKFQLYLRDKPLGYTYDGLYLTLSVKSKAAYGQAVSEVYSNTKALLPNSISGVVSPTIGQTTLEELERRGGIGIFDKHIKIMKNYLEQQDQPGSADEVLRGLAQSAGDCAEEEGIQGG